MPHGLGWVPSPPDERDLALDDLYTSDDILETMPSHYRVPHLPKTVYDQGDSPMCVAFSAATEQASFDLADLGHNFKWDEALFFRQIGGTINGAIIRNALDRRLHRGYPLLPAGSGNSAASHRISAYYSVTRTRGSLQRAIHKFGVIIVGTPWFNSWFDPRADGTLPPADYQVGGHAICVVGWNEKGLIWRNTWGKDWGVLGECILPWAFLGIIREAWHATDMKGT